MSKLTKGRGGVEYLDREVVIGKVWVDFFEVVKV